MTTQSGIRGAKLGRRWAVMAAVALSASLLGPLGTVQPALADVTFDQKMLELVNQHRAAAGIRPVQPSLVLNTIAGPGPYLGCGSPLGGRATDMGARNYFSHTILNCGNQSVFSILSSTVGLVYSAAAENIAWMNGTSDPLVAAERLMNDLMNSPGHRANVLDPRFTHVGIGSWNSGPGQTWSGGGTALTRVWVAAQVFAQMPLTAAPAVSLSPTSVGFGERVVGTTGPSQTVTVRNSGSAPLAISGATIGGSAAADFGIVSNTCGSGLASGASCNIAISFKPGAAGGRAASLSIHNNAVGSPHTVSLGGTGSTPLLTGMPINVVASGGDGQMTVTWAHPTSGASPAGYGVFVYEAGGYSGKGAWVCGTCTSAVITGLSNGTPYLATVSGHNGTEWGATATSSWVWVLSTPGAPTDVRVVPGNGSVSVTWQAPASPTAGIDGYAVFVYDANGYTGKFAWVCATCTSATVTGLTNGASYYPAIYAHNPNGWGPGGESSWLVAGTPGPPGNVVATKANGAVNVSWTPATAAGSPLLGYGAFVYDSAGYTGKYTWVCASCTSGTIDGLANGKLYTVLVYGNNSYGWGVAAASNAVAL